jgi:hypothetical protein
LPFSVSDEDGDAVTVLYRVDDDVAWSVLPTASGQSVLPVDVVSRLVGSPEQHKVEVTAFDGLEVTPFVWPWQSAPFQEFTGMKKMKGDLKYLGTLLVSNTLYALHWQRDWPQFWIQCLPPGPFNMAYSLDGKGYSRYVQDKPAPYVRFALPVNVVDGLSIGNHTIRFFIEKLDGSKCDELDTYNFTVTENFKARAGKN